MSEGDIERFLIKERSKNMRKKLRKFRRCVKVINKDYMENIKLLIILNKMLQINFQLFFDQLVNILFNNNSTHFIRYF